MLKDAPQLDLATLCVHGEEPLSVSGAHPLTTPIVQASVFAVSFDELQAQAAGEGNAYLYTRYANPTTRAAEENIRALEGAEDCIVTSSGQAAMLTAILGTCRAGDEIVAMQDLYGGSLKLFSEVLDRFGVTVRLVPFAKLSEFESFLSAKTRLVVLESPTNPTLRCADLAGLSAQAHHAGALVIVDNTFATPVLQRPLTLGADLVLHSATKYLGGHSDLTAGALCGRREHLDRCRRMHLLAGGTPDPHASYLLLRGLKTLVLRIERACDNAMRLAQELRSHPAIAAVFYPDTDPVAMRQMTKPGAMFAVELRGGKSAAEKLLRSTRLWKLAPSLGGVESTMSYPILASHAGLDDQWHELGITPGLVRLSVGIESFGDLLADLQQGLAA